jgi:hypothetical protein
MELGKQMRKRVRELLGIAYARELDSHLLELSKKFDSWKAKEMDCWELSEEIHKFHDGISRKLYNTYNSTKSVNGLFFVARALHLKLLQRDEIPEELIDTVEAIDDQFF